MTGTLRQQVDLPDLSRSLARLWAEAAAAEPTPLSRALTINLIVVAEAAAEPQVRAAVERLLVRHPCRVFLTLLDGAAPDVCAEVEARVQSDGKSRQTVFEEVCLRTTARTFAKIPGLIRPMVVNDIPVHLFWAAPLPENTWDLATMARLADQTIFDSCAFADPQRDFARLGEIAGVRLVDLSHFRLRPWRRALAEAFEKFEWQRRDPTHARIEHGPARGAACAAHVLGQWLRDRIDPAVTNAQADVAGAPANEPLRLELTHARVHVVVEHQLDAPRLRTTVTLHDQCLPRFSTLASRGQLGDLLAAAVDAL